MQVIVDGLLTHYEQLGAGQKRPKILILPGWADTSRSWMALGRTLAEQYEVLVVDLPGFGGTQTPPAAWGLDDFVHFIARFLQKIDATAVYALIGHSNGGAMAIRAVGQGKLHPQKLVLLASAGIRGTEKGRNFGLKVLAKTGKLAAKPLPKSVQQRLRAKLYTAAGSDFLVAEHMQETFKKVVADDVRSDAALISVPTLLVYGDNDTAAPPKYGEIYQGLIQASELKTIPAAGHFIHVENPEPLAAYITEFLA